MSPGSSSISRIELSPNASMSLLMGLDQIRLELCDPVTFVPLVEACTLKDCGHNFNLETLKKLGRSAPCPSCRAIITGYTENHTLRKIVMVTLETFQIALKEASLQDTSALSECQESLALGYRQQKEYSKALELLSELLTRHPKRTDLHEQFFDCKKSLALECFERKDYVRTLIHFTELLEKYPERIELHLELAKAYCLRLTDEDTLKALYHLSLYCLAAK